ncbi:hypothetical protein B0H13DRAFT_2161682 [Mycena leptocephala]|nr:hypothetical protein B0H13DRAFT_2161682 [Mycena leptocephala]
MCSASVLISMVIMTAGPRRVGVLLNKYPFYAQVHRDTYFLLIRQHLQRSKNDNNVITMPNEHEQLTVEILRSWVPHLQTLHPERWRRRRDTISVAVPPRRGFSSLSCPPFNICQDRT